MLTHHLDTTVHRNVRKVKRIMTASINGLMGKTEVGQELAENFVRLYEITCLKSMDRLVQNVGGMINTLMTTLS